MAVCPPMKIAEHLSNSARSHRDVSPPCTSVAIQPKYQIAARINSYEVYAVEYRLLENAPFPAVVMDAAEVYAHIIPPSFHRRNARSSLSEILVFALARWIRDEGHLTAADGLVLLSVSTAIPPKSILISSD